MKKNLLILFSSFLFLSNIAFGSITLQESKAFVVKELKKDGKSNQSFRNEFKKRHLKALLEDQVKKDQKILQFLKQDLELAILTTDPASIARTAEGIAEYLGGRLAWNLMPSNLQDRKDFAYQLKDIIEQAKKLYIPDHILLNIVQSFLDPQSEYSPLSFKGYVQISKTPEDYVIMKKTINVGRLIEGPFSSLLPKSISDLTVEFYYGTINNKISQWLKIEEESI